MFESTIVTSVYRVKNVKFDTIRLMPVMPNLRDLGPDAYQIDRLHLSAEIEFPAHPGPGSNSWEVRKYLEQMPALYARIVHYIDRVELVYAELAAPAGDVADEANDPFRGWDPSDLITITEDGGRALAERVA